MAVPREAEKALVKTGGTVSNTGGIGARRGYPARASLAIPARYRPTARIHTGSANNGPAARYPGSRAGRAEQDHQTLPRSPGAYRPATGDPARAQHLPPPAVVTSYRRASASYCSTTLRGIRPRSDSWIFLRRAQSRID